MTEQTPHPETQQNAAPQDIPPQTDPTEADAPETQAREETPEERIASLEAELEEMKNRWMRSEADNQNLRARSKRELEDARQYSVQKFARDVVEAAENLQRGLSALPAPAEGEDGLITRLREGFEGTERAFLSILERHGITRQDPTHQPFDANLHQAMQEQDSNELPPGYVLQAWTPTWLLKSRLLKPAMVIVSSASSTGKAPEQA